MAKPQGEWKVIELESIFPRGFSAAEETHACKIPPATSYADYSPPSYNLIRNKMRNKTITHSPINDEHALTNSLKRAIFFHEMGEGVASIVY